MVDPPDHTRLRRLVSKAFTPRSIERLRPHVQDLVDSILVGTVLDELRDAGEVDLMASIAYPLPVTVICELLGVPLDDRHRFAAWSSDASRLLDGEISATGFTTTDLDDNQLTGYYGGAMWRAGMLGLDDGPADIDAVIIGPNDPKAMQRLVRECRERRIPFVFDPAHQLPMMEGAEVTEGIDGAWIVIGNDYELELIQQRTGRDMKGLLDLAEMVVTTLGRHGSRITGRDGSVDIPPAPAKREADPTGAGDAYRAGLVAGLLRGMDLATAGRVASLAATYAVEQVGTIEHAYTHEEFSARCRKCFDVDVEATLWVG